MAPDCWAAAGFSPAHRVFAIHKHSIYTKLIASFVVVVDVVERVEAKPSDVERNIERVKDEIYVS